MKSFCNHGNLGSEPRNKLQGPFYLKVGDQALKVTARPSVPKAWESFLLTDPLHAKVLTVLEDGRAQIDCGSERGVWKGMELYADGSSLVEVIEVAANASFVKVKIPRRGSLQQGQQVHSRPDRRE